jgi:hypothetical protein
VLFPQALWPGLEDASVTVAFRRWRRPSVRAGGTLQTPAGRLAIDALERIDEADITDADARAAGHPDRRAVLDSLRPDGDLYRIRFHHIGGDPRDELRQRSDLSADELEELRRALARLEWAVPTLRLIAEHPATVSTDLAARLGMERLRFKQRVRRLKELGLTESLPVGYRLSPRGEAVLGRLA